MRWGLVSAWLCCLLMTALGCAPASVAASNAAASVASKPQLLWLTGEVTPPTRTELVRKMAQAQGLMLRHIDFPLRGPATLPADELAVLSEALRQSAIVWVDAPHASIVSRLKRLLDEPLRRDASRDGARPERVVWVMPDADAEAQAQAQAQAEAGATPAATATAAAASRTADMATYLRAGGERNVRSAMALAVAVIKGQARPTLPPVQHLPTSGLYHPDAPGWMKDAPAMAQWLGGQSQRAKAPAVAVLVHRYHFLDGSTTWLDDWLRRFERQGLFAYAVFAQQVDERSLKALLAMPGPLGPTDHRADQAKRDDAARTDHAHPRVLVSHQLLSKGAALQPLLSSWGVPMLLTQPYRRGAVQEWENDATGLPQGDVPFYLAQTEGAGGMDPMVVSAHADGARRVELIGRQADAVVAKARRLIALQQEPRQAKRLVAMVYNYPAGASNFGASFLNVPRSLAQVSGALADAGYQTRAVDEGDWIAGLQPLLAAYYPETDPLSLLREDRAEALPLKDYVAWWQTLPAAVRERIEAQWGPPGDSRYVVNWQGRPVFVIPRMRVGHLAVLPQPPREETLHRGQNPFMHRSKTPLSHHYLAVYLWVRQSADALIHFGTHGTQEWAPGKARGLDVHDDALLPLGDVPVIYPYIVDNLGEALTAKRRGRALMVSHRTPAFSPAGFEARMAHMHELMHEWETADAGPTRTALERELTDQFVEHRLHHDLGWTREAILADFPRYLELLHPYLDALAQSSQPKGLAVFGRVPDASQRHQTILQALRKPLIEALGEDIDEAFLIKHDAVASSRPSRWLDVALTDADAASKLDLRPPLPDGPVPNRHARQPIDQTALRELALRAQSLERLLSMEGEMPGLLRALDGGFIEAAYGGDPLRNPDSLPTGRNLTGLDPSRLPTRQAYEVARGLFHAWLKQYMDEHGGQAPTRLALSMWAGETLRHQGVMEAQALVAMGVQPIWDESGRPTRLALIPAQELKRPRVDVLLSITGSYRDQFPALMALIDQGVRMASQAEPGNALARNTEQVRAELLRRGVPAAQARALADARVFGNVVGDYGTGISDAVQSDGVQRDDSRLGEMFLARMSQPYVDGQPLAGVSSSQAASALGAHLRQTQAALMSRTSHLYAMATSDDPFQYLGGLSAAARAAGNKQGLGLYVSQLQDSSEASTESASRQISLEMQSRYLHPGWLQAQKSEGYAGTLQVLKAVQFTLGWQVTAPDTVRPDQWQAMHEVLVKDKHALGLRDWLRTNPQAYAQTVERLVQAQRMGYWQPDAQTRHELASLYRELTAGKPLPGGLAQVRKWVDEELGAAPHDPAAGLDRQVDAAMPYRPMPQPITQARPQALPEPAPAPRPELSGILLEKQPPSPALTDAPSLPRMLTWVLLGLLAMSGAVWQSRQRPMPHGRAAAPDDISLIAA